ncbi:MAG: adenylate/guanylate cyclase domain-containing protein [Candidatus Ozemobacteraceae bacterium]
MKNRLFRSPTFFLLGFFSLLVIVLDYWVAFSLEREKGLEREKSHANDLLETIYKACSNDNQLLLLLDKFHTRASEILERHHTKTATVKIRQLHAQMLAPILPAHDIAFSSFDPFRYKIRPIFEYSGGLGFAGPCAQALFRRMLFPFSGDTRLPGLKRMMTKVLQFPLSNEIIGKSLGTGLQMFNGSEGRRALYFNTLPFQCPSFSDLRNFLAIVLDIEHVPADFWATSLVRHTGKKDVGIAFLPGEKGKAYFSSFFRSREHLKKSVVSLAQSSVGEGLFVDEIPGYLVMIGQKCGPSSLRPIVAFPLQEKNLQKPLFSALFGLGILVVIGIIAFFSTRSRLPIGWILLLIFTFITALPILEIRTISRFITSEEGRRSEQEAGRRLHDDLKVLVKDMIFRQAALGRVIRSVSQTPGLEEKLARERKAAADSGFAASQMAQLRGSRPWCDRFNGFLLIVGSEEFSRFNNTTHDTNLSTNNPEVLQLLKPSAFKGLELLQEVAEEKVHSQDDAQKKDGPSKKDIEFEMVKDFISKALGNEMGYNLVAFPNRIQSFRMNVGQLFLTLNPVYFYGFPKYLYLWAWDESIFVDAYRTKMLSLSQQPSNPLFYLSISSQRLYTFPNNLENHPLLGRSLYDLALRSRDNNLAMLRGKIETASGPMVLEVTPGRIVSTLFAGGRLVEDSSNATREMFRQVVMICFLIAVLLALIAMTSFMAPLRRILGAIQKIGAGRYDVQLEDAERRDEFGTLARAFNSMMSGLKEKELLGKYVPDSVKNLVSGGSFQEKTQRGEQRTVTVLFSAIAEFEDFQAEHAPEDVFKLLSEHLSAMAEAVKTHGGEISKVMGEKIMVVFDHAAMSNDAAAAQACLGLLHTLKMQAAKQGFEVEVGLNSGSVIAGILGSPAVRLDYTVIGDTVNLASRLALLAHTTSGSRVVISGTTLELLRGKATATRLPFKKVKGKTQAVEVFLLDLA